MNDPDERDALDAVMDQSLRERIGGEAPPDLVDAVRARFDAMPEIVHRPHRWIVAAAVLVGCAVVAGVAWSRAGSRAPLAPPSVDDPQEPGVVRSDGPPSRGEPVQITTAAEAKALPIATRAVEVIGGDDATIEALVPLRDLEVLVVREPWNEAFGLSLKMKAPADVTHVTNAVWQHVAKFTKLRRLVFSGTPLVARCEGEHSGDVVTLLERLPLLESLALRFLDAPDVAIARLATVWSLRDLDLSFDHGFTDGGIDSLQRCRSLRTLSLRGCQQLTGVMLAKLGRIPTLEELDLSSIDGMNWRAGQAEPTGPGSVQFNFHISGEGHTGGDAPVVGNGDGGANQREVERLARLLREAMERRRAPADRGTRGVHDETIAALAQLPKLRVLDIGSGAWTHAGLAPLENCTTLEDLRMTGGGASDSATFVQSLPRKLRRLELCGTYPDEVFAAIREHLSSLRSICIAACDGITDAGIRELLAMSSLRELDMRQLRGVTAACVDDLAKATQLESVDLRHCDAITTEHVERLRRVRPDLRVAEPAR